MSRPRKIFECYSADSLVAVRVHRLAETDEYRVRFYRRTDVGLYVHRLASDYFTSDKQDALGTAHAMCGLPYPKP